MKLRHQPTPFIKDVQRQRLAAAATLQELGMHYAGALQEAWDFYQQRHPNAAKGQHKQHIRMRAANTMRRHEDVWQKARHEFLAADIVLRVWNAAPNQPLAEKDIEILCRECVNGRIDRRLLKYFYESDGLLFKTDPLAKILVAGDPLTHEYRISRRKFLKTGAASGLAAGTWAGLFAGAAASSFTESPVAESALVLGGTVGGAAGGAALSYAINNKRMPVLIEQRDLKSVTQHIANARTVLLRPGFEEAAYQLKEEMDKLEQVVGEVDGKVKDLLTQIGDQDGTLQHLWDSAKSSMHESFASYDALIQIHDFDHLARSSTLSMTHASHAKIHLRDLETKVLAWAKNKNLGGEEIEQLMAPLDRAYCQVELMQGKAHTMVERAFILGGISHNLGIGA